MSSSSIEFRGVRVHNLKGVDSAIPIGQFTVITGVSGAGKSSLLFDTLFAESQRRYLQSFSTSTRQLLERFDQPDADHIGDLPPAIRSTDSFGNDTYVADVMDLGDLTASLFAAEGTSLCPDCGQPVRPFTANDVADALMALPPGTRLTIGFPDRPGDEESPTQWAGRLKEEGWIRIAIGDQILRLGEDSLDAVLPASAKEPVVVLDRIEIGKVTSERLLETVETGFRRGDGRLLAWTPEHGMPFDRRWRCPRCGVAVAVPQPRLFDWHRDWSREALSIRWRERSIADLFQMPLPDLSALIQSATPNSDRDQLLERLHALEQFGLFRLSLGRRLESLASGEQQRLRLCRATSVQLAGALYLFEEPSAGLDAAGVADMLPHLIRLRDAGNTVVAIDHHPAVWKSADHVIDIGPGAGDDGGRIVYQGDLVGLGTCEESATAAWLAEFDHPSPPSPPRKSTGELRIGDVALPLGVLCVLTGRSAPGKTRFLQETLMPALAEKSTKVRGANQTEGAVLFDQTPLARSSRSNPATAMKIFDDIRDLFAQATDAKIRNLDAGEFSFNQPGGRCETCEGQGRLTVDMQFLADVQATCPECLGRRYRREVLNIKVRGLSIDEVLNLTAREAFRFFRAQRSLEKKLKWLLDVGLDYLRLGQPMDTLSAGETQRLKLAAHLAKSRKPRSLFVLIEPTRGLHPQDVARLTECFGELIATGHSLIVEDHNPFLIAAADVVIDFRSPV